MGFAACVVLFAMCVFVGADELGLRRVARALAFFLAAAAVFAAPAFTEGLLAWATFEAESVTRQVLPTIIDSLNLPTTTTTTP